MVELRGGSTLRKTIRVCIHRHHSYGRWVTCRWVSCVVLKVSEENILERAKVLKFSMLGTGTRAKSC